MEKTMERLGIFDPYQSRVEDRVVDGLKKMKEIIAAVRLTTNSKGKIVLTQGSFDAAHVGHDRYLEKSRQAGAFLVVGIDSDEKMRKRKGPKRPVVPEEERAEVLCHKRYCDLIIIKQLDWPKWALIDTIRPDILVVTEETYTEEEVAELKEKFGCELVILPPQAETSTTARIRTLMIEGMDELIQFVIREFPKLLERGRKEILDGVKKPHRGGKNE